MYGHPEVRIRRMREAEPPALAQLSVDDVVQLQDQHVAVARALDFTAPPTNAGGGQINPGSTWNFQFWFRDPMGPGGNGFNLSDGLQVDFCP